MEKKEIELLETLKRLLDEGVLNNEEFEAQKKIVLASSGPEVEPRLIGPSSKNELLNDYKEGRVSSSEFLVKWGLLNDQGSSELSARGSQAAKTPNASQPSKNRNKHKLVIAVFALLVVAVSGYFVFSGSDDFDSTMVENEIAYRYDALSPVEIKDYVDFVKDSCSWKESEQIAFAEGDFEKFSNSSSQLAREDVNEFKVVMEAGCGAGSSDILNEVLVRNLGEFWREISDNCEDLEEWCTGTGASFDLFSEYDLKWGDSRTEGEDDYLPKAMSTWWNLMTVNYAIGDEFNDRKILISEDFADWKLWKISESNFYYCVKDADGVCLLNSFLRVKPPAKISGLSSGVSFYGPGPIAEVTDDSNSERVTVSPLSGWVGYNDSQKELTMMSMALKGIVSIPNSEQVVVVVHLDQYEEFRQKIDLVIDQFSISDGESGTKAKLTPCVPSGDISKYRDLFVSDSEIKFLGKSQLDDPKEIDVYFGKNSQKKRFELFNSRQKATFNDDGVFLLCVSSEILEYSTFVMKATPETPGEFIMRWESNEGIFTDEVFKVLANW